MYKLYVEELKRIKIIQKKTERFANTIESIYASTYQREKEQSEADGLRYSEEDIERNTMLQIQPLIDEQERIIKEYCDGE